MDDADIPRLRLQIGLYELAPAPDERHPLVDLFTYLGQTSLYTPGFDGWMARLNSIQSAANALRADQGALLGCYVSEAREVIASDTGPIVKHLKLRSISTEYLRKARDLTQE